MLISTYLSIKQVTPSGREKAGMAMSKSHGKFVWYDVMTTDTKAAESFYRSVIGWDTSDSGMTDRSYTLLCVGSTMVGGLMPIPEDARRAGVRAGLDGLYRSRRRRRLCKTRQIGGRRHPS